MGGGDGNDALTGGVGDDHFNYYGSAKESVDNLLDFHNIVGDNDVLNFFVAGTYAGLLTGALAPSQFRIRADNLAQDADDRFIFRTTDTTLWFDSNGNAAGGLREIADLQAGATVTFADIIVL